MGNKAYKFRIYPNDKQAELINKTFGCTRFIWNVMLAEKIEVYETTGKSINLTPAKYKNEFEWLKEVDSLALANVQLNLNTAFKNFFRDKKIGFPNFKNKHKARKSYTTNMVNNNIKIDGAYLVLPKVGKVKTQFHRQISDNFTIKSVTVSQESSGEYYASILVEYIEPIIEYEIDYDNSIGLDFSMKEGYVDSNGNRCEYPRFFRQLENRLAKEQRILARRKEVAKKRGIKLEDAKNYQKQRIKVARLHQRIKNQRRDFLHKKSRELVNTYDVVCIEDLNMKGMSQALNFGKSVADNGWGKFTTYLAYKLENEGKKLVKIGKYEPSSKRCHMCGFENQELTLATRRWQCPICHSEHDRDINAAINIKQIGLSMLVA